jgi:Phosphodiester glycosidase
VDRFWPLVPVARFCYEKLLFIEGSGMSFFTNTFSSGTHIIAAAGGVQMVMLVRSRTEYFTDFIEREARAKGLKAVVNGSFVDLSYGGVISVKTGNSPLDASSSTANGQVIQDGRLVAGSSSTGKFFFSQNTCGVEAFSAGSGNPPNSSCAAIGGIAPIIVNDLPYGTRNLYRSGVPAGAPATGDVAAEFRPFLIQKSNAMFSQLLARGGTVGKTAIGYDAGKKVFFILSQSDGQSGLDAEGIRYCFSTNSAENAVFLDCSDSATLYYDGRFLVRPGQDKNEFLTVAVGFK